MPPKRAGARFVVLSAAALAVRVYDGFLATVSAQTRRDYDKIIADLGRHGCARDYDGVKRYLASREPPFAVATAEKILSAVNTMNGADQLAYGRWRPFTESERKSLSRMATGRARAAGVVVQERGSITYDLLERLTDFMAARGAPETLIFAVQFCFATSSREDKVDTLAPRDFKKDANGDWYLEVPKDHDPTALRMGVRLMERRTIHAFIQPRLDGILEHRRELRLPATRPIIGQVWKADKVRAYIKEAARRFGWDPQLDWCIHSLRHGSAGTAVEAGEEPASYTGHAGQRMATRYGRGNTTRVDNMERQRQLGEVARQQAGARRQREE